MINLPWSISISTTISVTKLKPDGFGGTNVECSIDGIHLKPFTLNRDVAIVGADALLQDIQFMVMSIIGDGCEVSE